MDKSSNLANGASANQAHGLNPTPVRESISASVRRAELPQFTRPAPQISQAPSLPPSSSSSSSPFASREPSPIRPSARSNKSVKAATAASQSASPGPAAAAVPPPSSASAVPNPVTPGIRTRRSSQQDLSPSRLSRSGIPTPATSTTTTTTTTTTQKTATLSNTTIPSLPPATSDAFTVRTPGPQKSEQPQGGSPRWPIPPRLRSPPPVLQRPEFGTASSTAPTSESPSTITTAAASSQAVTASHRSPLAADFTLTPSDSEAEDSHLISGMRTPSRTIGSGVPTLETVQEASPLGSPRALDAALEKLETASIISNASVLTMPEVSEVSLVSPTKTIRARQLASHGQAESGSESCGAGAGAIAGAGAGAGTSTGSARISRRAAAPTSAQPPPLTPRHSSSTIRTGATKGKTGEGAQATMTVETETVTSIPNVAVGPAAVQGVNGSLRTRPSTETIRPKKERKKTSRKQPAVTQGSATSKADIFEAKVASAVDEANTSDSEETFVYDSNPAESRDRPLRFHHSRTPSATSMSMANDRSGMRSIHSVMEGAPATVAAKKSMKFVNTFGNSSGNDSALGDDEAKGTAGRGIVSGSGRGTVRLHHHVGGSHIGRWGLSGPKNGHQSLFDNESPFPVMNGTTRMKLPPGGGGSGNNSLGGRQSNGPASPRASGSVRGAGPYSKRGLGINGLPSGYDMDETSTGRGEDERTPLISPSMRSVRNGRASRRHHVSLRSLEQQQQSYRPSPSFLNRFASCLVLTVMLMLVISGAIGFMFATSQPLEDIELVKISGVIASEQELMFDLMVRAHNPNVVVVTVDAADMEVFAKSPHAGTDSEWWRRPRGTAVASASSSLATSSSNDVNADDADKEPRDQPDSSPNFLLGKFTDFDNPLSFEGSFFHHGLSTSRSGVRIRRPGNGTDGGSERWERILEDEFDLIVKGVLRYSLPLSQRVRSALIEGRTTVKPNAADGPALHPNGTATIS